MHTHAHCPFGGRPIMWVCANAPGGLTPVRRRTRPPNVRRGGWTGPDACRFDQEHWMCTGKTAGRTRADVWVLPGRSQRLGQTRSHPKTLFPELRMSRRGSSFVFACVSHACTKNQCPIYPLTPATLDTVCWGSRHNFVWYVHFSCHEGRVMERCGGELSTVHRGASRSPYGRRHGRWNA